ncbi:MAG: hypothetical protein ABIL50_03090 [candidate division WOR-3 bacterium]
MLSAPVLILKSFSFYSDSVEMVLKSQLQGMAHVFDWEKSAKGSPENFYRNLWEKTKDKYLAVVVLGDEPLQFAMKYIKEKPVIYVYNYHQMDTLFVPKNFIGVFGAISPVLHLEKMICAFEEGKILGILIHRDEWEILKDVFEKSPNISGRNPINEIHIRLIDYPTQIQTALKDLRDFGVKILWIPPTSVLNFGKYAEEIAEYSKKFNIGISSYDVSNVRVWSVYAWQPSSSDMGSLILETLYEVDKISKEKENTTFPKVKVHYIFSVSSGIPALNKTLANKLKLKVSESCYFKQVY